MTSEGRDSRQVGYQPEPTPQSGQDAETTGAGPPEENCRAALRAIAEIQPRTLQALREAGVVFDRAPLPPTGDAASVWQSIAFGIYTALCEADTIARGTLNE